MKRIYYIMVLAALLPIATISANSHGKVHTKLNEMKIVGDSLYMQFDIELQQYSLPPSYQLTLYPILTDGAENQKALQGVLVEGKRRVKLNKRLVSLGKSDGNEHYYEALVIGRKPTDQTVNYEMTIPVEPWMLEARLYLWGDECGCGNSNPVFNQTLLGYVQRPEFLYRPEVTFLVPPKETIKNREETGTAYLIFPVNGTQILPEKDNNAAELRKISETLEEVKTVQGVELHNVIIRAFASPEGPYQSNLVLSQKRAAALKDYVRTHYGIPADRILAEGMGEDWNGLVASLKLDDEMAKRDEVLAIINDVDVFAGRENKLMALDAGRPYRYMLQTHYPALRRSEYVVNYTVPGFNLEDAKRLLSVKPALLSLEEMYQIANSYDKGSAEFREVFEIAVRIYPTDRIANLNAAAAALQNNNVAYAASILDHYTNDPEAWTNIGVLKMLQGDVDSAKTFFIKARDYGVKEAQLNLEQIEKAGTYSKLVLPNR